MNDKPIEISEDLKDIVSSTIESIREGLKGKECAVSGPIEFELAIIKMKEAKGGLKFLIADASGNYCKESVSKIKFQIRGTKTQGSRFPLFGKCQSQWTMSFVTIRVIRLFGAGPLGLKR